MRGSTGGRASTDQSQTNLQIWSTCHSSSLPLPRNTLGIHLERYKTVTLWKVCTSLVSRCTVQQPPGAQPITDQHSWRSPAEAESPRDGLHPQIALWPAASLFEKAGFHQLGCVGQEQFLPTPLLWRQQTDTTFVPFHPPRPEKSQMPSWRAGSWHCAAPTADFLSGQLPLVNIGRVSKRMCGSRSPIQDCDYDCAFAHRRLKLYIVLGHVLFLFGEELIWACYLWTATILPWKWERGKDVAWSLLWLENRRLHSGPVVSSPLSPAFSLQNSAQLRRYMWCFMLGDSFSK